MNQSIQLSSINMFKTRMLTFSGFLAVTGGKLSSVIKPVICNSSGCFMFMHLALFSAQLIVIGSHYSDFIWLFIYLWLQFLDHFFMFDWHYC